jgi:hypothetical protein
MTKKCCTCENTKDVAEFAFRSKKWNKHRHGVGVYAAQCKECHKEYVKKHYHDHQKEYYGRVKAFKQQNRLQMYSYLADKKCVDCGENDPLVLDFDHKDKRKKERGIAEMLRKNCWKSILKEIEKCEIRCSNCHRRRTAKQLGYMKYLLQQNETEPRPSADKP